MPVKLRHKYPSSKFIVEEEIFRFKTIPEVYIIGQCDFDNGTLKIKKPGLYILEENIVFHPQNDFPELDDNILKKQGSPKLGWFSAISIASNNVIIDLNGHSIVQSNIHYLKQRIFSIIELGNSFFGELKPVKNILIKNGILGLTSHSGIHGNNNSQIVIENVEIMNFEVAGIQLNGVEEGVVSNCRIHSSLGVNKKVPVNARFSSAIFLQRLCNYLKKLNDSKVNEFYLKCLKDEEDYEKYYFDNVCLILNKHINEVVEKVSKCGLANIIKYDYPTTQELFGNQLGLPDGGFVYGISINSSRPVVDELKESCFHLSKNSIEIRKSNDVIIRDTKISKLKIAPTEGVAIDDGYGKHCKDYSGSLIMASSNNWLKKKYQPEFFFDKNGNFDLLTLCQVYFYKLSKLDDEYEFLRGAANMSDDLINWVSNGVSIEHIKTYRNTDIKFNVMEGTIGLKLANLDNAQISNCLISNIENLGHDGLEYDKGYVGGKEEDNQMSGHPLSNTEDLGYLGNISRGVSIVKCTNIYFSKLFVYDVYSYTGSCYGVDFINNNIKCTIKDSKIKNIKANKKDYPCILSTIKYTSPNYITKSIGLFFRSENTKCGYKNVYIQDIFGTGIASSILIHGDVEGAFGYLKEQNKHQKVEYYLNSKDACTTTLK